MIYAELVAKSRRSKLAAFEYDKDLLADACVGLNDGQIVAQCIMAGQFDICGSVIREVKYRKAMTI